MNRRLNKQEIIEINENRDSLSQYELASEYGITRQLVRKILKWEL